MYILGDLFTNSSGHPVQRDPRGSLSQCCGVCRIINWSGYYESVWAQFLDKTIMVHQGCQMVYFDIKNTNLNIFGGPWNGKLLVYFMAIRNTYVMDNRYTL
jgi:hypothetical protein